MNALWLSHFSLWADDALEGKFEEEPDCRQLVLLVTLVMVKAGSEARDGHWRAFSLDLAVLCVFPLRWERTWKPGQVYWEGKAEVSSVLSVGAAGACVPGLWMASGWCCLWKGACTIFEALQQGIQAFHPRCAPALGQEMTLKHGYCVTLAGGKADKHV